MKELIEKLEHIAKGFLDFAQAVRDDQGVSFNAFMIADAARKAAKELKRCVPMEAEVEGGGHSWWYVCPECHGGIIKNQHFCQCCGQKLQWTELKVNNNKEGSENNGEGDTGYGGYGDRDL